MEQDIRNIAAALDVRTILEGSVRRAGTRIRVTAQLINAADGYHLWSERYDRELTDVFAVQDEIAAAIANALQIALQGKPVVRYHMPALPAYEAYLNGWHHMMQNTAETLLRSVALFEQAMTLDPQYVDPHVALGECHVRLATEDVRRARDVMPRARAEAQKAMAFNPTDPGAQALMGVVSAVFDYDWTAAERSWLALGDRTSDTPLGVWLGIHYLARRRRVEELLALLRRRLERGPLNLLWRVILGHWMGHAGTYDLALTEVRKVFEIDAGFWPGQFVAAEIHGWLGEFDRALEAAERCFQRAPWQPRSIGLLAGVLDRMSDRQRAEGLVRALRAAPDRVGVAMGMVQYYMTSGRIEEGMDWFERAAEQREPLIVPYVGHAQTKALQSNPRWAALIKTMNLPEMT